MTETTIGVTPDTKDRFDRIRRQIAVDVDKNVSQDETVRILTDLYTEIENPDELIAE